MHNRDQSSENVWIHIRVPLRIKEEVEEEAKRLCMNRSVFLRLLILEYFKAKEGR